MSTLEQQLKQAEDLVASVRLQLEKRDEVKPVYPKGGVWSLNSLGEPFSPYSSKGQASLGNTFYTWDEAEEEAVRRRAESFVREAINKVNGGKIFIPTLDTCIMVLAYDYRRKCISTNSSYTSAANHWEFIKGNKCTRKLIKDPDFCRAWLLMKGIKQ